MLSKQSLVIAIYTSVHLHFSFVCNFVFIWHYRIGALPELDVLGCHTIFKMYSD